VVSWQKRQDFAIKSQIKETKIMKWLMRMLDKTKKERHGFTLIELMIVLIIVAILAVAAVPTYTYFVRRAYESEASASLGAIKTAEIVYHAEHAAYTGIWTDLGMDGDDFAQNKWFGRLCFYISGDATTFLTTCDGSLAGEAKVAEICVQLTQDSDITKGTVGTHPGQVCPAGT